MMVPMNSDRQGARTRLGAAIAAFALVLVACGGGTAGPSPSPGPPLGETALRYLLDERFAPIFFCDPDYYPVGSEEGERTNARAWWAGTDQAGEEAETILAKLGLSGALDDADVVRVYREHKRLATVALEETDNTYRFRLRSGVEADADEVTGVIERDGTIRDEQRAPANTSCPICLAAETLIDTPSGPIAVTRMEPGMAVWTMDEDGRRIEGVIVRAARRDAGSGVLLVRVFLSDGRSVVASAAHPAVDGRPVGALAPGDALDGSTVETVEVVVAADGITYDVLSSGPTGAYWADGVLLGSTLASSIPT